jgi:hypothetical protein
MRLAKTSEELSTAVASYPSAWDVAVKCKNDQLTDIQAIQAVYEALPPPALLSTVATIVGAIYADTYWVRTRMDPSILSASLQKAGGWYKADCDKAAQGALAKWYGLLLRSNFNDAGLIPRGSDLTSSPDVLTNMDGPLDKSTMLRKWNSRFYNAAPGMKNYAYARAQSVNIPVEIKQPKVRMFYTTAGFNQPPSSWQILYTFDKEVVSPMEDMKPGPIGEGGRCANTKAFNFEHMGSGHYCLIAVASTEFFTNDPTSETGNWNSLQWMTYNGAAGWHNVDVLTSTETTLKFYNQDATPERFVFRAHCSKLPEGTVISLESADHQIRATAREQVSRAYQLLSTQEVEVPAHFEGDLKVRIVTPKGAPLPAGASVEVEMLWVLPQNHTHYRDGARSLGVADSNQPIRLSMGSFAFVGAVR